VVVSTFLIVFRAIAVTGAVLDRADKDHGHRIELDAVFIESFRRLCLSNGEVGLVRPCELLKREPGGVGFINHADDEFVFRLDLDKRVHRDSVGARLGEFPDVDRLDRRDAIRFGPGLFEHADLHRLKRRVSVRHRLFKHADFNRLKRYKSVWLWLRVDSDVDKLFRREPVRLRLIERPDVDLGLFVDELQFRRLRDDVD
jgi:hypothetical protein